MPKIFSTCMVPQIKALSHETPLVSDQYESVEEEMECQKYQNATRNPVLNIPLPKHLVLSVKSKRTKGHYGHCLLRWTPLGWFWLGPCFDPCVRRWTKQDFRRTVRFLRLLERGYDPCVILPAETASLVLNMHPEYMYFAYSHGAIALERRLIN